MLSPPFDGAQVCSSLSCIQHLLVSQLTANNYTCMTLVKECGRDEKEKKKKQVVAGLTQFEVHTI